MEPKLEDIIMKLTPEATFVGIFPFSVDDLEGDIFVGRPGSELQHSKVSIARDGHQLVLWGVVLLYQVREENVELVALHNLGGRIVHVVVSLVVLVPFKT